MSRLKLAISGDLQNRSVELITTIAAALGLAQIFGCVAVRLKLPALIGYLLAGIVTGPYTPGFVADPALAGQLAEIGVMLLMFGVGLHFSLDDLLSVKKIALRSRCGWANASWPTAWCVMSASTSKSRCGRRKRRRRPHRPTPESGGAVPAA